MQTREPMAHHHGIYPLGEIYVTRGVELSLSDADIGKLLNRHAACDWGECGEEDIHRNLEAIQNGYRVFSSYTVCGGETVQIVTEADRSATTVQLAGEF